VSEARLQWAPWEEDSHAYSQRMKREEQGKAARVQLQSAEAFSGVVKHPVPWSAARSPRLREASTR